MRSPGADENHQDSFDKKLDSKGCNYYNNDNDNIKNFTLNVFKSRLEKFWQNQDVVYDCRADIQGTGNHINLVNSCLNKLYCEMGIEAICLHPCFTSTSTSRPAFFLLTVLPFCFELLACSFHAVINEY